MTVEERIDALEEKVASLESALVDQAQALIVMVKIFEAATAAASAPEIVLPNRETRRAAGVRVPLSDLKVGYSKDSESVVLSPAPFTGTPYDAGSEED